MDIVATRAVEGLPRSFTVAEIRRMVEAGIIAEDESFELIEGDSLRNFQRETTTRSSRLLSGRFLRTGLRMNCASLPRPRSISMSAPSSNRICASTRSASCPRT